LKEEEEEEEGEEEEEEGEEDREGREEEREGEEEREEESAEVEGLSKSMLLKIKMKKKLGEGKKNKTFLTLRINEFELIDCDHVSEWE